MNVFDRVLRHNNKVYISMEFSTYFIGLVRAADSEVVILSDAYEVLLGGPDPVLTKGELTSFRKFQNDVELERRQIKWATIYPHKFPCERQPGLYDQIFPEEREG